MKWSFETHLEMEKYSFLPERALKDETILGKNTKILVI